MAEQKRFTAAGMAVFAVAAGALLFRVSAYFVFTNTNISGPNGEVLTDLMFTLPVQVLVCFLAPLLIYKLYQKKSIKEVFLESNFVKTDIRVLLLSVVVGIAAIFFSTAVGNIWLSILISYGYNYNPAPTEFSQTFNIGYFLLAIFFTACLPAFCEEFAIRGTFLNAMRGSVKKDQTLLLVMALSFGLFHQNIVQLLYTAIFGGVMAFLVLKTRSIYPAIVAHFANNAFAVVLSYADNYGWFADPSSYLTLNYGFIGLMLTMALGGGAIFLAILGILSICKKVKPIQPLYLYKPSARETAFYVGAIVLTSLSTILTFAFAY